MTDVQDTAMAARRRRMEVRKNKAMTPSGPLAQRKDFSDVLLLKSGVDDDPAVSAPPDELTLSALAALRCKFRREQFRRLPKKDGAKDSRSHSPRSPTSSLASFAAAGAHSDDGSSVDGMRSEGSDGDDTDDVASEVSSSGTDSSADEGRNEAEMEAAISLAANLLKEEHKAGALGAAGNSDGPAASAGAVSSTQNLAAVTSREAPPSGCRGAARADGRPADDCPANGVSSVCGRRREMEDAVALAPAFAVVPCSSRLGCKGAAAGAGAGGSGGEGGGDSMCQLHLFCVFDGHGGNQAADFCAAHLAGAAAEELALSLAGAGQAYAEPSAAAGDAAMGEGAAEAAAAAPAQGSAEASLEEHWKEAMTRAFVRMDAEISGHCEVRRSSCSQQQDCQHEPLAAETVGTTAVVLAVSAAHLVVANAGDSRAVLARGGQAVPLSKDHKPEREDEMKRVEKAGGRVIFWNGYRVLGVLAMSRAIGDRYLKPYVIAEPEVTFTLRSPDDEFVILASDGLWDVMTNEAACDIARRCLAQSSQSGAEANASDETSQAAAAALEANKAAQEGQEEKPMEPAALAAAVLTRLAIVKGSGDNISVVVVDLRPKK